MDNQTLTGMVIGTVVLLIMAVLSVMVVVLPAVKITQKLFSSHRKKDQEKRDTKTAQSTEEQKESTEEDIKLERGLEFPSDEVKDRYLLSGKAGMTENTVSGDEFAFDANPKEISQDLATSSGLTLVGSEFRRNASQQFRGFNIMVEDGVKVTLTYAGQALAQIRREVNDITTSYHIYTFPPKVNGNILPGDVELMLNATARVRNVSFDPNLAYYAMRELFCDSGNLDKLRSDIDPQIQEKESSFRACELLHESVAEKQSGKTRHH